MSTAYGFVGLEHLFNQRVSQVGVERSFTAVQESATEHTRVMNEMIRQLAQRTIVPQEQVELSGDNTLQSLDEHGIPKPVRPSGSYQVGYPIYGGGTAWGDNRVSRSMQTLEELNRHMIDAQVADANWLRIKMLVALLDNTTGTYNDKAGINGSKGLGNITIQPLANGDSVTYVRRGGSSATDNHYLAQAADISDAANPFPIIRKELVEHPSNGGEGVIVYVASDLTDDIEGLASFAEVLDPDVTPADNTGRLNAQGMRHFGDEVLGKSNKCWIVEWSALPSGYMVAQSMNAEPPLAMREYASQDLQGFFPENWDVNGNNKQTSMIRYAGFGVKNRVSALVYQIGNATYQIPSGYAR